MATWLARRPAGCVAEAERWLRMTVARWLAEEDIVMRLMRGERMKKMEMVEE